MNTRHDPEQSPSSRRAPMRANAASVSSRGVNADVAEVPAPVRGAALLGGLEGVAGIAYGVFLMVRDFLGYRDTSAVFTDARRAEILGYGTGVVFIVFFGAVCAAAWFLYRGKRWGRGPIVMLNMLLIPIAFYIHSAGHTSIAIACGLVALIGLGLLFNGVAVRWAASQY